MSRNIGEEPASPRATGHSPIPGLLPNPRVTPQPQGYSPTPVLLPNPFSVSRLKPGARPGVNTTVRDSGEDFSGIAWPHTISWQSPHHDSESSRSIPCPTAGLGFQPLGSHVALTLTWPLERNR